MRLATLVLPATLLALLASMAGCPGTLDDKARFEQAASSSESSSTSTTASGAGGAGGASSAGGNGGTGG